MTKKHIAKNTSNFRYALLGLVNLQRQAASKSKKHMVAIGARNFLGLAALAGPETCLFRVFPEVKENTVFFLSPHSRFAGKPAENLHGRYSGVQTGIRTLDKLAVLPNCVSFHRGFSSSFHTASGALSSFVRSAIGIRAGTPIQCPLNPPVR